MIKRLVIALSALVGISFLVINGCSKNEGGIDTSRVQAAFQTNDSGTQHTNVQKALAQIRSGDYSGALASLQKAAATLKLTPEQKSAIDDLVSQIKTKTAEALKSASKSAGDAINNAGKGASQTVDKIQDQLKK